MECLKLNQESVSESIFQQIMEVENSTGDGYSESAMRRMWQTENINDNFVCKVNNKIVGIITFNPNSKRRNGSVYMVNLTVLPQYRRRGIAQSLILCACDYYLKKQIKLPMSLSVDRDNNSAYNLYLKVGYEVKTPITQIEKDDDGQQLIMEATLQKIKERISYINEKIK